MNTTIKGIQIPSHTKVNIEVSVSSEINVTPFIAMQKVNRFFAMKVGNLLHADLPEFAVENRVMF